MKKKYSSDDIVTKIDTEQLGEDKELSDVVGGKFVGSVVTLEIWRDNATLSLSATLSEFSE